MMTLGRNHVQMNYKVENTVLESVNEIKDLGVLLDTKLNFSAHVSNILKKANRSMGLLIRSFQAGAKSSKFNSKSLLTAYNANVRSHLEYCSVIWSGAAKTHTQRIDRAQHRFLMWLNSHCRGACPSLAYAPLLKHFGIVSLESRRFQHDILFLKHVYSGKIQSGDLVAKFPLHVPPRFTRLIKLLAEPCGRVDTVMSGLLCHIPRRVNSLLAALGCDFFASSNALLKKYVLCYTCSLDDNFEL